MNLHWAANALGGMFDWTWRTSLEASVLLGVVLLLQRAGGRHLGVYGRYVLSLLVLVRLLLPAVPASGLSIFNVTKPWIAHRAELEIGSAPRQQELQIVPTQVNAPSLPAPAHLASPQPRFSLNLRQACTAVWGLGCASLLAVACWRQRRFKRWVWTLQRHPDLAVHSLLESVKQRMGVTRRVALLRVENGTSPALFGWWRPRLLLPDTVLRGLTQRELSMVLLHELAHVRRHDVLLNWISIVARALHWFNPLVWLALRRLRADRELVCDALVLRALSESDRHVYGETLIKLVTLISRPHCCPSLVPVLNHKHEIKRRITMISSFGPPSRKTWAFTAAAVLAVCCFTFTRAADPVKAVAAAEDRSPQPSNPAPQAQDRLERLRMGLDELEARIRAQQREVDNLRLELGIPPDMAEGKGRSGVDNETVRHLERERITAVASAARLETLLKQLQSLQASQVSEAIHTALPDAELSQLLRDLNVAEVQYTKLRQSSGEAHPLVKELGAMMETIRKQTATRVGGVIKGLSAQIAAQNAQAKSLKEMFAELSRHEAHLVEKSRPYFRAKRDLEILERVREGLLQQVLEQQYGAREDQRQ